MFSDEEIILFLKEIKSIGIHISEVDSLVPATSQSLLDIHARHIPEDLKEKVTETRRPYNHLTGVNGKGAPTIIQDIVARIDSRQ